MATRKSGMPIIRNGAKRQNTIFLILGLVLIDSRNLQLGIGLMTILLILGLVLIDSRNLQLGIGLIHSLAIIRGQKPQTEIGPIPPLVI